MQNKFLLISFDQFRSDYAATFGWEPDDALIRDVFDALKLPMRATRHSAGYDFFSPIDFTLKPGESIKLPTGIRAMLKDDRYLMCAPRSGLGFKYRLQLDNTIGIIDADYFSSDNEGHIFAKLTNDGKEGKRVTVRAGEAFMQGIIQVFDVAEDDAADGVRNGGFGSTMK